MSEFLFVDPLWQDSFDSSVIYAKTTGKSGDRWYIFTGWYGAMMPPHRYKEKFLLTDEQRDSIGTIDTYHRATPEQERELRRILREARAERAAANQPPPQQISMFEPTSAASVPTSSPPTGAASPPTATTSSSTIVNATPPNACTRCHASPPLENDTFCAECRAYIEQLSDKLVAAADQGAPAMKTVWYLTNIRNAVVREWYDNWNRKHGVPYGVPPTDRQRMAFELELIAPARYAELDAAATRVLERRQEFLEKHKKAREKTV